MMATFSYLELQGEQTHISRDGANTPEGAVDRESQEFCARISPKISILISQTFKVEPEQIETYPMEGETYNWVVGVTITLNTTPRSWFDSACGIITRAFGAFIKRPQQEFYREMKRLFCVFSKQAKMSLPMCLVVRIPRNIDGLTDERLEEKLSPDLAALEAISARANAPIPKVLSSSLTTKNPLELPYMVLDRLPGQQLGDMWETFNLAQKKSLMKQIIELVSDIATIEAAPGNISIESMNTAGTLSTAKLPVPHFPDPNFTKPRSWPSEPQTPAQHLLEKLERWREYRAKNEFLLQEVWHGFKAIIRSLERQGFLQGPCVLAHGDLRDYNLLCKARSETEGVITGVLDWDFVIVAPEFMAYRAPF